MQCIIPSHRNNLHSFAAVVNCGTLPEVSHGSFSLSSGTGHDSVATYSCDTGYVLEGSSTRQCQANEGWSGVQPICKRVFTLICQIFFSCIYIKLCIGRCSALSSPTNGVVLSPNPPAVQGDRAFFSCNADYELIGATTSTCQANGLWSTSPPTCECEMCMHAHDNLRAQI